MLLRRDGAEIDLWGGRQNGAFAAKIYAEFAEKTVIQLIRRRENLCLGCLIGAAVCGQPRVIGRLARPLPLGVAADDACKWIHVAGRAASLGSPSGRRDITRPLRSASARRQESREGERCCRLTRRHLGPHIGLQGDFRDHPVRLRPKHRVQILLGADAHACP